jgi:hypothetical protein
VCILHSTLSADIQNNTYPRSICHNDYLFENDGTIHKCCLLQKMAVPPPPVSAAVCVCPKAAATPQVPACLLPHSHATRTRFDACLAGGNVICQSERTVVKVSSDYRAQRQDAAQYIQQDTHAVIAYTFFASRARTNISLNSAAVAQRTALGAGEVGCIRGGSTM